MSDTIENVLRYARLGIDLVTGIVAALKSGKDLHSLRVVDVIPEQTQLELAKLVADEAAKQKFEP